MNSPIMHKTVTEITIAVMIFVCFVQESNILADLWFLWKVKWVDLVFALENLDFECSRPYLHSCKVSMTLSELVDAEYTKFSCFRV